MRPDTTRLWTIGHSNHSLEHFLALLDQHEIQLLADVRRFPSSKKFPHFNQQDLKVAVESQAIEYRWLEGLGGRRNKQTPGCTSTNTGLRNQSFRNYADYMLSPEFRDAFNELAALGEIQRTAIMCSESVFWRCHRRLISDYAISSGISVEHIFPDGRLRKHELTAGAVAHVDELARVTYPGVAPSA